MEQRLEFVVYLAGICAFKLTTISLASKCLIC